MNSLKVFILVSIFIVVVNAGSLSVHRCQNAKDKEGSRSSKNNTDLAVLGQRRFIGAITGIWTAFNSIANFAGNVNNIDAFISNVKKWIGIGDDTPPPATAEQVEEIKKQIDELEDDIADMKSDLLAGAEWGYVLSVLGGTISQLKTLVTNEERYLQDMESDERSAALKKRLQNRFFVEQVIGINQAKIAQIRDALVTVQNGITDGTGSLHKPLFEAYADKIGEQASGTVFDVVAFITYIQKLQIHTYAVLNNSIDFTDMTDEEKLIEYDVYKIDISRVIPDQGPKIAIALNVIVDHRGTSAWGLIKLSGSSKCLFRKPHPHPSYPAFLVVGGCPSSPGQQYMWRLDANNYLINEADPGKHAYFRYKPEARVSSSTSRNVQLDDNNQHGEYCATGPSLCDKLTFEYSTKDYEYLQIKQRTRRDCIGWKKSYADPNRDVAKIIACGAINSPVKDYRNSPTFYTTWFTWEPKKRA